MKINYIDHPIGQVNLEESDLELIKQIFKELENESTGLGNWTSRPWTITHQQSVMLIRQIMKKYKFFDDFDINHLEVKAVYLKQNSSYKIKISTATTPMLEDYAFRIGGNGQLYFEGIEFFMD